MQKLAGCVTSLGRFISKLGEHALPFFKLMKKKGPFNGPQRLIWRSSLRATSAALAEWGVADRESTKGSRGRGATITGGLVRYLLRS